MFILFFIDFDNTLFPSFRLTRYFRESEQRFVGLPLLDVDHLLRIDHTICNSLVQRMSFCKHIILTRSSASWIRAALTLLPTLRRFVAWKYVDIIHYDNLAEIVVRIIGQSLVEYDVYFICSDSEDEINVIHTVQTKTPCMSVKFVSFPTPSEIEHQWSWFESAFEEMKYSKDRHTKRYFNFMDDQENQNFLQACKPGVLTEP